MDYAVVMAAPDIYHHGIKGQKWGVRRFQNKDGSLTFEGKRRYSVDGIATENGQTRNMTKREQKLFSKVASAVEKMNSGDRSLGEHYKQAQYIDNKLLKGATLSNIWYETGVPNTLSVIPSGRHSKVVAIDVEGRRAVNQVLSNSQTKALNKVVKDQRKKRGEAIAGLVLGGSLAGLTWSYLKDLGMV